MLKRILLSSVLCLLVVAPATAQEYVIGSGDVLQVSVWGVPQLSGQMVVRPDGKITLPAVGDIIAAGSTPKLLAAKIKRVLKDMVKSPVVTLSVVEVTNNRIYVAGGGVPSEVVPLASQTTLFQFLCRFDSLAEADLENAYLLRDGVRIKNNFATLVLDGDLSSDLELEADDIVFIPSQSDNKIYIVGAVNEPRYIFYRPGLTVLDAILEAGGFTEFADKSDVLIIRRKKLANGATEKLELEADIKALLKGKDLKQNHLLHPGDYVNVKEGVF